MSLPIDIDLSEWEVVQEERVALRPPVIHHRTDSSELPAWVRTEYCARMPEPFTIHASAHDGQVPQWAVRDYLAESL